MTAETQRRSDYDVTNRINTTDPQIVSEAVCGIYRDLYQQDTARNLPQAFTDLARLYRGEYPGFRECDTDYHDLQHVLDVTLGMARLLDGCVRAAGAGALTERLFRLGIVSALYHDCGYIRRRKDTKHANGAEYTTVHVARGVEFLEAYLPKIGMADLVQAASRIVHFTGYEMPLDSIRVADARDRLVGHLLGTADMLAQMADRCYLEKCRDRLYAEFVLGDVAVHTGSEGTKVLYGSGLDLLRQTPKFISSTIENRLGRAFNHAYRYVQPLYGGDNPYMNAIRKNVEYLQTLMRGSRWPMLRRNPPVFTVERNPMAGMRALLVEHLKEVWGAGATPSGAN